MRRPIIDWDKNNFTTVIDGIKYKITTDRELSYYRANAFIPSYIEDQYCTSAKSYISTEDAILKLVRSLEKIVMW